jgi:hypothetical protein
MLKNHYLILEEEIKGSYSSNVNNKTDIQISIEETPYEPRHRDFDCFTTIRGCGFGKEETRGGDIFNVANGESIKSTSLNRDELGSTISGSI